MFRLKNILQLFGNKGSSDKRDERTIITSQFEELYEKNRIDDIPFSDEILEERWSNFLKIANKDMIFLLTPKNSTKKTDEEPQKKNKKKGKVEVVEEKVVGRITIESLNEEEIQRIKYLLQYYNEKYRTYYPEESTNLRRNYRGSSQYEHHEDDESLSVPGQPFDFVIGLCLFFDIESEHLYRNYLSKHPTDTRQSERYHEPFILVGVFRSLEITTRSYQNRLLILKDTRFFEHLISFLQKILDFFLEIASMKNEIHPCVYIFLESILRPIFQIFAHYTDTIDILQFESCFQQVVSIRRTVTNNQKIVVRYLNQFRLCDMMVDTLQKLGVCLSKCPTFGFIFSFQEIVLRISRTLIKCSPREEFDHFSACGGLQELLNYLCWPIELINVLYESSNDFNDWQIVDTHQIRDLIHDGEQQNSRLDLYYELQLLTLEILTEMVGRGKTYVEEIIRLKGYERIVDQVIWIAFFFTEEHHISSSIETLEENELEGGLPEKIGRDHPTCPSFIKKKSNKKILALMEVVQNLVETVFEIFINHNYQIGKREDGSGLLDFSSISGNQEAQNYLRMIRSYLSFFKDREKKTKGNTTGNQIPSSSSYASFVEYHDGIENEYVELSRKKMKCVCDLQIFFMDNLLRLVTKKEVYLDILVSLGLYDVLFSEYFYFFGGLSNQVNKELFLSENGEPVTVKQMNRRSLFLEKSLVVEEEEGEGEDDEDDDNDNVEAKKIEKGSDGDQEQVVSSIFDDDDDDDDDNDSINNNNMVPERVGSPNLNKKKKKTKDDDDHHFISQFEVIRDPKKAELSNVVSRVLRRSVLSFVTYFALKENRSNAVEVNKLTDLLRTYETSPLLLQEISEVLFRILSQNFDETVSALITHRKGQAISVLSQLISQTRNGRAKESMIRLLYETLKSQEVRYFALMDRKTIDVLFGLCFDSGVPNKRLVLNNICKLMSNDSTDQTNFELVCAQFSQLFPKMQERAARRQEHHLLSAEDTQFLLYALQILQRALQTKQRAILQNELRKYFDKILLVVNIRSLESHKLCVELFRTIRQLIVKNQKSKDKFSELTCQYTTLKSIVLQWEQKGPSEEIMMELFLIMMDVESNSDETGSNNLNRLIEENNSIQNPDVMMLIFSLIEYYPLDYVPQILERMARLVNNSVSNCHSCVSVGLTSILIRMLDDYHKKFESRSRKKSLSSPHSPKSPSSSVSSSSSVSVVSSPTRTQSPDPTKKRWSKIPDLERRVIDGFLRLIEILGQHSMTVKELKAYALLLKKHARVERINIFQPLVRSLSRIARQARNPCAFFDFSGGSNSGLRVKISKNWPTTHNGYTIAFWIRFDQLKHNMRLVCISDPNNESNLDIYFSKEYIEVMISRKKQTRTKQFTFKFSPGLWFHVCIVHATRKLAKTQMRLFINGKVVSRLNLRMPTQFSVGSRLCIGHDFQRGSPSFIGQFGSFLLFEDPLVSSTIQMIYGIGPNYMSPFLPVDSDLFPKQCSFLFTGRLCNQLSFAYCPLAYRVITTDDEYKRLRILRFCENLANNKKFKSDEAFICNGTKLCRSMNVGDVIAGIGGIWIFLPLILKNDEMVMDSGDLRFSIIDEIIGLIFSFLENNSDTKQSMLQKFGFRILGFLLKNISPQHINNENIIIQHFGRIFHLLKGNDGLLAQCVKYILFDMRIWIYTRPNVQKMLYQTSFIIFRKHNYFKTFRSFYSVQKFLDNMRLYYWIEREQGISLANQIVKNPTTGEVIGQRPSNVDEILEIRELLLNILRKMVISEEDVSCVLNFLVVCNDVNQVNDVLQLLLEKMLNNSELGIDGGFEVFMKLLRVKNEDVRVTALKCLGRFLIVHNPKQRVYFRVEKTISKLYSQLYFFKFTERVYRALRNILFGFISLTDEDPQVLLNLNSSTTEEDDEDGSSSPAEIRSHHHHTKKKKSNKKKMSSKKSHGGTSFPGLGDPGLESSTVIHLKSLIPVLFKLLDKSDSQTKLIILKDWSETMKKVPKLKSIMVNQFGWQDNLLSIFSAHHHEKKSRSTKNDNENRENEEIQNVTLDIFSALLYHALLYEQTGFFCVEKTMAYVFMLEQRGLLGSVELIHTLFDRILTAYLTSIKNVEISPKIIQDGSNYILDNLCYFFQYLEDFVFYSTETQSILQKNARSFLTQVSEVGKKSSSARSSPSKSLFKTLTIPGGVLKMRSRSKTSQLKYGGSLTLSTPTSLGVRDDVFNNTSSSSQTSQTLRSRFNSGGGGGGRKKKKRNLTLDIRSVEKRKLSLGVDNQVVHGGRFAKKKKNQSDDMDRRRRKNKQKLLTHETPSPIGSGVDDDNNNTTTTSSSSPTSSPTTTTEKGSNKETTKSNNNSSNESKEEDKEVKENESVEKAGTSKKKNKNRRKTVSTPPPPLQQHQQQQEYGKRLNKREKIRIDSESGEWADFDLVLKILEILRKLQLCHHTSFHSLHPYIKSELGIESLRRGGVFRLFVRFWKSCFVYGLHSSRRDSDEDEEEEEEAKKKNINNNKLPEDIKKDKVFEEEEEGEREVLVNNKKRRQVRRGHIRTDSLEGFDLGSSSLPPTDTVQSSNSLYSNIKVLEELIMKDLNHIFIMILKRDHESKKEILKLRELLIMTGEIQKENQKLKDIVKRLIFMLSFLIDTIDHLLFSGGSGHRISIKDVMEKSNQPKYNNQLIINLLIVPILVQLNVLLAERKDTFTKLFKNVTIEQSASGVTKKSSQSGGMSLLSSNFSFFHPLTPDKLLQEYVILKTSHAGFKKVTLFYLNKSSNQEVKRENGYFQKIVKRRLYLLKYCETEFKQILEEEMECEGFQTREIRRTVESLSIGELRRIRRERKVLNYTTQFGSRLWKDTIKRICTERGTWSVNTDDDDDDDEEEEQKGEGDDTSDNNEQQDNNDNIEEEEDDEEVRRRRRRRRRRRNRQKRWTLDTTENRFRMRLKLKRDYSDVDHSDASASKRRVMTKEEEDAKMRELEMEKQKENSLLKVKQGSFARLKYLLVEDKGDDDDENVDNQQTTTNNNDSKSENEENKNEKDDNKNSNNNNNKKKKKKKEEEEEGEDDDDDDDNDNNNNNEKDKDQGLEEEDDENQLEEKTLISNVYCEIITPMQAYSGKLEITTSKILWFVDRENECYSFEKTERVEKLENVPKDKVWKLGNVREIHLRRYQLTQTAIEIFFHNRRNILLNFKKRSRNKIFKKILQASPKNLAFTPRIAQPGVNLRRSGLTELWVKGYITNFEYLMSLNTFANRTYNDLSQYPVFPWILSDYTSQTLDLTNPEVYRDLSLPIGALDPEIRTEIIGKFNILKRQAVQMKKQNMETEPPWMYGSHYSSSAIINYYLIRLEPFTTFFRILQGGFFDHADRMFDSIPQTWKNCRNSGRDFKELIPEFFYMPEFLTMINDVDLGTKQSTGQKLGNVKLPPWAKTPEEFIRLNREALESEYVSQHIHHWIDLIWGYKQTGVEAEHSFNVFRPYTYEGMVDIDRIENERRKISIISEIQNFGQTPSKLFSRPHPKRKARRDANRLMMYNPIKNEHNIWIKYISKYVNEEAIAYVRVTSNHQMVAVTSSGLIVYTKFHFNAPNSGGDQETVNLRKRIYFSFENSFNEKNFSRNVVSSVNTSRSNQRFTILDIQPYLVFSCQHWDKNFKCTYVRKTPDPLMQTINRHKDLVTCLTSTCRGDTCYVISGSKDTTVMIWDVDRVKKLKGSISEPVSVIKMIPIHVLYGHDDEITCVAVNAELDVVVSGSKDKTCIVHSLKGGRYIRTLEHPNTSVVDIITVSDMGYIVVHSRSDLSITLYSINGKILQHKDTSSYVCSLFTRGKYLFYAEEIGVVFCRKLYNMQLMFKYDLKKFGMIQSLFMKKQFLFAGTKNGNIVCIKFSEKFSEK